MPELREPLDPELYRLMRVVAKDALSRTKQFKDEGKTFGYSTLVPRFDETESKFRTVSRTGNRTSYTGAFGESANDLYPPYCTYQELEGYEPYSTYASALEALTQYYRFPTVIGSTEAALRSAFHVEHLPISIMQRHIDLAGWDFSEETFNAAYCELEQSWIKRELPVEVVIPIVGVSFSSDVVLFDDTHRLERITEGMQLARWPAFNFDLDLRRVLPCATHAFVIQGGAMRNESFWGQLNFQTPANLTDNIEVFFQALLTAQREPSGYAQILYRPVGWATGYEGALPPVIHGPVVRKFSPRLAGGLTEPSAELSSAEETGIAVTFKRLRAADKNVSIATTRLLSSTMREADVDRIIDLCIGIEALVSDNSPGDTTYKLAMRSTAVLASRGFTATDDFYNAMKGIYTYRSSVAHGGKDAEKKRLVTAFGQKFPASNIAESILRRLLHAFLEKNMTPQEIDKEYLLKSLKLLAEVKNAEPDTTSADPTDAQEDQAGTQD